MLDVGLFGLLYAKYRPKSDECPGRGCRVINTGEFKEYVAAIKSSYTETDTYRRLVSKSSQELDMEKNIQCAFEVTGSNPFNPKILGTIHVMSLASK
jgi:hypothetical protein